MNQEIFRTTDFYSAVILRSFGVPLIDLEKSGLNTLVFIFQNETENCEELLKKYWDRKLSVEPRAFIETINELKIRIHQSKGGIYGS